MGARKVSVLTATVLTRPRARCTAATAPAMSICDMIHPPNTWPCGFASGGMGTMASTGVRPLGSSLWEVLREDGERWISVMVRMDMLPGSIGQFGQA